MIEGKKLICVLPAYNAEHTLEKTLGDVTPDIVDLFILVDDCSNDKTIEMANLLAANYPLKIIKHDRNLGYGGNQKTCYREALKAGGDVIIMLHPDYQYEPRLLGSLASLVATEVYDIALGSRILGKGALTGGMPLYKYIANRFLTLIENLLIGQKLSEYHTGYRAFTRRVLEMIPFEKNDDDFIFDNEIIVQCHLAGFRIGEISVPTKYFEQASSINFRRSVKYGFGVLRCAFNGLLARLRLRRIPKYRLQEAITSA